jgi:Flp pilus assembly protein TadD
MMNTKYAAIFALLIAGTGTVSAQDDETRRALGLPMMIGENSSNQARGNLSGKVTLIGVDPSKTKPVVFVSVLISGAQVDRRQAGDNGNYVIPNVPRQNAVLVVEVDGNEVGRFNLLPTAMGSIRQDVTINLGAASQPDAKTGVISARNYYQRSEERQQVFDKASAAAKDRKPDNAIQQFRKIIETDAKDFVAWTELGTLLFRAEKFVDAEKAYGEALKLKPDFEVALLNLGKLHMSQKQPEKAVPVLAKAVEVDENSADANHYLGEALLQTKRGSLAVGFLNDAIRLAPIEKAEIHLRLAALYNGAGMKDKAAAEFKQFLSKVPNYKEKATLEKYIADNSPK